MQEREAGMVSGHYDDFRSDHIVVFLKISCLYITFYSCQKNLGIHIEPNF